MCSTLDVLGTVVPIKKLKTKDSTPSRKKAKQAHPQDPSSVDAELAMQMLMQQPMQM